MPPYRIVFVCSGNICRSPMAEVIARSMLADAGLAAEVSVDSAGTGGWHEGEGADRRTVRALADHGYDGSSHRAREFDRAWFAERDLILVADRTHLDILRRWAPDEASRAKVRLLREYDDAAVAAGTLGDRRPLVRRGGGLRAVSDARSSPPAPGSSRSSPGSWAIGRARGGERRDPTDNV